MLATPQMRGKTIRLLGVAAPPTSARASSSPSSRPIDARQRRAVEATDLIRRRFGARAITRARLLDSRVAEPFERDPMTAPEARRSAVAERTRRDPLTSNIRSVYGSVDIRTSVLQAESGKERAEMAMIRITPLEVHVRTDWFDGRPRSIRIDRAERARRRRRGRPSRIGGASARRPARGRSSGSGRLRLATPSRTSIGAGAGWSRRSSWHPHRLAA